jgi:hypothetical protein
VLRAGETCPACGEGTYVYALVAAALYHAPEEDTFTGPLVLKDIESLPRRVLALLEQHCPGWRLECQDSTQSPSLRNHCQHCGAVIPDQSLHAEPGSAFCPTSPADCLNIHAFAVPAHDPVPLVCSCTAGGLTDWLELDRAKPLTGL